MISNAISYLLGKKIKNSIKQIFKSPAKLIYAVLMIVLLVFNILARQKGAYEDLVYRDMQELAAVVTAFYILMFILLSYNGFKNGAAMFKLADINLLFPSPIHPRKILFYALIQQLGTSLLLGLFIIFQYTWMSMTYGIGWLQLILILIGYSLSVFCAQLTGMAIYSFTSSSERRKSTALTIFFGMISIYAIYIVLNLMQNREDIVSSLVQAGNSLFVRLMPAGGWIASFVNGILLKDNTLLLMGILLSLTYIIGTTLILSYSNQDYYEDVLKAGEEQHVLISAKKEGRLTEAVGKVKVKKTGLNGGAGASTFFYKHALEQKRSRKFILEPTSLIFLVIIIIFAAFVKELPIVSIVIYSTYMQMISVKMGRFSKELSKPFIYLVPKSSFSKIFWSIAESFTGFAIEAGILYIVLGFMLQLSVLDVILLIIMRVTFSYIMLAGDILSMRIFGALASKTFIYMFYVLSVLVLCAPAIAAAIVISVSGVVLFTTYFLPFLVISVSNILVVLLVIFLCRNMLDYAELK